MDIDVEKQDRERAVLHVAGRVDAYVSERLKQEIQGLAAEGFRYIVLGMREVTAIDSSGLGALVSGFKAMRERDGRLVVAELKPPIRMVIELTRLDRVLPIYDDIPAALAGVTT